MKLNKRKGFTVVELVIVIAIIAVLAAVLIPTFAGLVRKANISKDTQLVRNLNTALATATEKPKTMHEALQIAADAGYLVDKINASATSNEVLYDSKNNVFCYYNATNPSEGSVEYIPESAQGSQINDPEEYYLLWKIYDKNDDIPAVADQKFSVYLADDAKVPADGKLTVSVGFDAGTNTKVNSVSYSNTENAQVVVIRTNSGETNLTVNAANDTVMHYGAAGTVNVLAVDDTHSYHEFGSVYTLTAKSGHIVLESGSLVYKLEKADNSADATFVSNGTVVNANSIEGVTEAKTYDIYNLEQLCAFRDYVNAGMDFGTLPVEIKADIDMSSVSWLPIGTLQHPFHGTINGNDHALSGLNPDERVLNDEDWSFTTSSVKSTGSAFGLIGIAGNGNIEVKNLTLKDVNINLATGQCVGALIGFAANKGKIKLESATGVGDVKIDNVTVYGSVTAMKDVGGLVGKIYHSGDLTLTNCTNNANVMANGEGKGKAGGIVGFISGQESTANVTYTLDKLTNNGNVTAVYDRVGGICSYIQPMHYMDKKAPYSTTINITNCANTGTVSQTQTTTTNQDYIGAAAGIIYEIYTCDDEKAGNRSISGNVTLNNCSNTGTIEGTNAQQITSTTSKTIEFKYDKTYNTGNKMEFTIEIGK